MLICNNFTISNTPLPTTSAPPPNYWIWSERQRLTHYSIRTKTQYLHWVKHFIAFHGKRPPKDLGEAEVEASLSHLAVDGNMATLTQNHALSALLFPYREVLGVDLPWMSEVARAKRFQLLPVVLT
ncbi:MAG: phage integrase N-terminal SAM-like domain-containing protein [Xanthomonadales bacterium]|nr:phage integrase N-terminal SAM-like domain-containing protein [Xanthomonadales bacterium]